MGKAKKNDPVKTTAPRKGHQLPSRVSDSLWDDLKAAAKKERRSVAQTVIILLEEALAARKRRPPPADQADPS